MFVLVHRNSYSCNNPSTLWKLNTWELYIKLANHHHRPGAIIVNSQLDLGSVSIYLVKLTTLLIMTHGIIII